MNPLRTVWLATAAAALGAIAWSGPAWAIGLATIIPAFWSAATSRWAAGTVWLAYQLAATRGAPAGIATYYGTWFALGAGLWLLAAMLIAGGWALVWSSCATRRCWGCLAGLVITAFPPLGVAGWVHPVTAAGALFPATGWIGLAAHVGLMTALPALPPRRLAVVFGLTAAGAFCAASAPRGLPGWAAVDTHHDFGTGVAEPLRDYERQLELIAATRTARAHVVLLPESAGGRWTRATAGVWQPALPPNRLILLGAEVPDRDGRTANALIAVDAEEVATVYRQRMPVPLTMWHPWSAGGTRAYWFDNPVVTIAGRRAAVFICHEQVLIWPVLHSLACRPEVFLACANAWWCAGTTIPAIERSSIETWARLFALPCLTATNS
jgi:hypothetical protein